MYCTNCGGQNKDNAKFCFSCGKPLGTLDATVVDKPLSTSTGALGPRKGVHIDELKPKKNPISTSTWILGVIIGLIILYLIFNWGQSAYRAAAAPSPAIVSKGVENVSRVPLAYDAGVWAEIRNDGGDGTIAMEATFTQEGQTYKKSETRYFKSLETARMEIVFKEAKEFGGVSEASINVFPYGK